MAYNKEASHKYYLKNKERMNEASRKYHIEHKEHIKEQESSQKKGYYIKNKEHILERTRIYQGRNREKAKVTNKIWREKNKEHIKEYQQRYDKEHFEQKRESQKRWKNENKERIKAYLKEYRVRKEEHYRNYRFNYKYGITLEKYDALFIKQEGKCAICGKSQDELKKILSVDHNHKTDKIRGLLCEKCNFVLGHANDDIDILQKAIRYLEAHNAMG